MAGNESDYFDYTKLLAAPLRRDPVWRDLADACNKVLGREIEELRRRVTTSRDSVKNRRGDIISQITYLPESDKPAIYADTGDEVTELNVGDNISKAIITRVISNGSYFGDPEQIDYFQVEFKLNDGRTAQWLLPTSAPQERSLLIKNSYTMGFDFFNSKLSTKDYERLYEYLGMFWPDNGPSDNFIQFIGFMKNLKLYMVPLWSFDDGTDYMHILEEDSLNHTHASQGGQWYLTSHVEVRYDIALQNKQYAIDFDEFVELFYLFAPIMLVLERITGVANVLVQVAVGQTVQAEIINYGINEPNLNSFYDIVIAEAVQAEVINYGINQPDTTANIVVNENISVQVLVMNYGCFYDNSSYSINVVVNTDINIAPSIIVVNYGIFEDFSDWEYNGVVASIFNDVNVLYPADFEYN